MPQPVMLRSWSWTVLWRPTRPLELTPQKDVLFVIGDWSAKIGSQETPGGAGKFGLGVQNEAGQKANRVLPRECTGHSKHPLPTPQEKTTLGHHHMANTKILT